MAELKLDSSKIMLTNDNSYLQNNAIFNSEFNNNNQKFLDVYVDNKLVNEKLTNEFYTNSANYELIYKKNFKNKEVNLEFPRTFVNIIKDETKKVKNNQFNRNEIEKNKNKIKKKISSLQMSLFANIPQTIYFGLKNEPIVNLGELSNKILYWKLSSITPALIREIVVRSGFLLIKDDWENSKWVANWCKHQKSSNYAELNSNQKINHFPGSYNFGRKDFLWNNLCLLALHLNDFDVCNFYPQTYILPKKYNLLKEDWISNPNMKIILKPPASARGIGIQIIHNINQIPKEPIIKPQGKNNNTFVAQHYIENPLLLFNQNKFDIRLYVLITSFDPLLVYLYNDGLARFASEKYTNNLEDLNNQFVHLTNFSVNKNSATYKRNNDENSLDGHKWTLKTLLSFLSKTRKDVNIDNLVEQLIDLILKTVISCQHSVRENLKKYLNYKYNCYELLGFDILFDSNLKPWLLEVNVSPCLSCDSSVDVSVKSKLIKDMFNIVGYRLPLDYKLDPFNFVLSDNEKKKKRGFHKKYIEVSANFDNIYEICKYDFGLTDNLTPDDLRYICLAEDELARTGSFKRLFPSTNIENYLPLFVRPYYYNYLLFEWEKKYGKIRMQAVSYLQALCKQGMNMIGKRMNY